MGKIYRRIKDFCKRYIFKNKLISIAAGIVVVGVLLFVIFSRINVDSIKIVKKVLSNNFYKIECMSDSCDYIIAYKGEKLGNTTIYIYNAYGKKIASYKENFKTDNKIIKNIFSISKNYIIFKKEDVSSSKIKGYLLTNTRIKTKYSSENVLLGLNDYLISEKLEDTYNIINNDGKVLYTNVNDINIQADGKIISINIKKEDVILNEKGDIILNGYRIVKQVRNDNSKVIYLVLQDSNKNAYYYYNIKNNKIVGDSFNSYVEGSNTGELIITKKENNETVKYILKQDGSTKKLDSVSMNSLKNIDLDKYDIVYDSYILQSQKVILVYSGNSFGTYNIVTNKYTELCKYEDLNKKVSIGKLLSNEKDFYLQINLDGKTSNKLIVYDMVNDKSLYEINNKDYKIQYFTNYGDYNVVKYSSESNEEYKNKYAVYDKKNKEVFRSNDQIVIIDKDFVFGKEYSNYSLILFSAKKNKALNDSDTLANKVTLGKSYFYKYNDSEKTYLFNDQGEKLKVINSSKASLMYSTETLMYIENDEVFIINPTDNKTSVYRLNENEKINTSDGLSIPPYRNTLFINNTVNNYAKVVNVKGRVIKNIKNSTIESVDYNEESNNVIIITKQIKDNNNYYGLYIGK